MDHSQKLFLYEVDSIFWWFIQKYNFSFSNHITLNWKKHCQTCCPRKQKRTRCVWRTWTYLHVLNFSERIFRLSKCRTTSVFNVEKKKFLRSAAESKVVYDFVWYLVFIHFQFEFEEKLNSRYLFAGTWINFYPRKLNLAPFFRLRVL